MTDHERWQPYTTFKQLGGCDVTEEQLIDELHRLPLDGVLGFLGRLSLGAVRPEANFYEPAQQGALLNLAIVDDFPARLPSATSLYEPGHVPHTGGRHIFIHQRNIVWLAHHAILHCQRDARTPELSPSMQQRICRLLLIANDFFADPDVDPQASLEEGREFVLDMMRLHQFIEFTANARDAMNELARQWRLFATYLPRHYDVKGEFTGVSGVELDEYFEFLALLISCFFHTMPKTGNPWQSRDQIFAKLESRKEIADTVLRRWVRTPDEYAKSCIGFNQDNPLDLGAVQHFDYVALQMFPVIEGRAREIVVPVLPYLYFKAANEPYFLLAAHNAKFRSAYGKAYEDYAHEQLSRIAAAASDGPWRMFRSPPNLKGKEYCDSVLTNGSVAVVFEHKGGRIATGFLRGGSGDRVLGPSEQYLARLDSDTPPTIAELKKADKGLLTCGIWQMARWAPDLIKWLEAETGQAIDTVWPVVTYQANARIEMVARVDYLKRLLDRVQPFPDDRWMLPEWLHNEDLEALAALAENGKLDLADLLQEKRCHPQDESFNGFLRDRHDDPPIDPRLDEVAKDLLSRAGKRFWPNRHRPDGR